jgi:hypothetical protein
MRTGLTRTRTRREDISRDLGAVLVPGLPGRLYRRGVVFEVRQSC